MIRIYDVSAIIHSGALASYSKNWHKDYFPTGGLYKLFSLLLKDMKSMGLMHWNTPIKKDNHNNIILCLDSPVNYRKQMVPSYKANRAKNKSEIDRQKVSAQLKAVKIICEVCGIPYLEKEGYEADDLIYSVVAKYPDEFIIINADDSDLESVALLNKKAVMNSVSNRKIGELRQHILVEKIVDGDPSDNIPALPTEVKEVVRAYFKTYPYLYFSNNKINLAPLQRYVSPEIMPQLQRNVFLVLPKMVELDDIPQIHLNYDNTIDVMNALGFKKFLKSAFNREREYGTPGEVKVVSQLAPLLEDQVKNYFLNIEQRELARNEEK